MKQLISFLFSLIFIFPLIGCKSTSTQTTSALPKEGHKGITVNVSESENEKVQNIFFGNSKLIQELHFSASSANFFDKDSVTIHYMLTEDSKISITLVDEDGFVVRTLLKNADRSKGTNMEVWDGKDDRGITIPNEVYFPIFIAEGIDDSDTLNPLTVSGGVEIAASEIKYDKMQQLFSYKTDKPARITARMGKIHGVLLKTLVDAKPRLAGINSESWNGQDDSDIQNISAIHEDVHAIVYGYTLPQPALVTFGNDSLDYRTYKREHDTVLTKRYLSDSLYYSSNSISRHFKHPRLYDHAPEVILELPQCFTYEEDGTPVISNKTLVSVDLASHDKQFKQEQYEITFFLDNVFYAEEEVGYAPYNWLWRISNVPEGYHILTVNLSSFNDRIGSKSIRIKVN